MTLSQHKYQPTMLLLHDCAPKRRILEGDIIIVDMDKLLMLRRENEELFINQTAELPATVCFESQRGSYFAKLFDDVSSSSISGSLSEEFITHLRSTWEGSPRALNNLDNDFELRVWDVGQGNTNSIFDGCNLTLFDFGASIYHSKTQLENIIHRHAALFKNRCTTSLIISHWDVDHYNLLCAVDDAFLCSLSCVFYPSTVIGLTAKQIEKRLHVCHDRFAMYPALGVVRAKCGIKDCFTNKHYTLFTGEQCRNKNKSGLLMALYSATSTAFLTADHTNYQVWNQMYHYIQKRTSIQMLHIVVPHHGGNCGKSIVQMGTPSGIAAFSVGSNNYGHPCKKVLDTYKNAKYQVLRTDRNGDIIIPMK